MLPKWSPISFVRYATFLAFGILFYVHSDWGIPHTGEGILVLSSIYAALVCCASKPFKRKAKSLFGFIGFALIFLFGYWLTEFRTEKNSLLHISKLNSPIEFYQATVISEVQEKAKSYKAELAICQVRVDSTWQPAKGRIMAYFPKKDSIALPKYGDIWLIKGNPDKVSPPQNPYEFDYRRYLAFHQIHHQHFLRKPYYRLMGNQAPSAIYGASLVVRQKADSLLRKYIPNKKSYAIATALVLGVKDGLDNEIKNAYASAGAMHVLAVSGLHVGIIFQILTMIFGFLKKRKKGGNWAFAAIALSFLWCYAFITGLSPSVMRAVTMFSFIIVAQAWGKQTNIYNTLALSAVVLLCWNPYMLMEVGFQLSYAAVVGIVYLQPKFTKLWKLENRAFKWMWELTCVSVAAQIATFPIGLLYFHQFPTYFWLSNFIVIPAASLILQGGIAILTLAWLDWAAGGIGWLLGKLIEALNYCVFWMEELPAALLKGIDISVAETWLIYACIFSLTLLFALKKLRFLAVTACLTLMLMGMQYKQVLRHSKQKMLAVYHTSSQSNLCLTNGGQAILLGDSALVNDSDKLQFSILHHFWAKNIEHPIISDWMNSDKVPINQQAIHQNRLIVWEGKSILIYREPLEDFNISVDYLIIQKNTVKKWRHLEGIQAAKIIFDSSNSYYTIRDFKPTIPEKLKSEVHFTRESGAFMEEFD